jgi:hypothetical protein
MSWFDEAGNGQAADVAALMDSAAPDALWRLVQAGALVSIGSTSDGGALGVTVTLDGKWRREYFRDSADLCEWLGRAVIAVEDEAARPTPPASSGRRTRSRRSA